MKTCQALLVLAVCGGGIAHAHASTSTSMAPAAAVAKQATVSDQLAAYYADADNYRAISREVTAWHHTTKNSCVAYAATALWHIGAPLSPHTLHNGELASRLLQPFAAWLEATYVAERIAAADLRAGDLVFAGTEAAPVHVYVFLAWKHKGRLLARVADNQGRQYVRPIKGNRRNYSPFAFALRLVCLRSTPAVAAADGPS